MKNKYRAHRAVVVETKGGGRLMSSYVGFLSWLEVVALPQSLKKVVFGSFAGVGAVRNRGLDVVPGGVVQVGVEVVSCPTPSGAPSTSKLLHGDDLARVAVEEGCYKIYRAQGSKKKWVEE